MWKLVLGAWLQSLDDSALDSQQNRLKGNHSIFFLQHPTGKHPLLSQERLAKDGSRVLRIPFLNPDGVGSRWIVVLPYVLFKTL